jgi:hypothetical protein
MKKVLKAIGVVLGILALLVIGGVIYLSVQLDSIVEHGIEREGSAITKTAVELGDVDLSPFSGKGAVHDLSIANPEGFASKSVLEVGTIEVSLDPWSVLDGEEPIMVHEVVVDEAVVTFEIRGRATNVGAISDTIDEGSDEPDEAEAETGQKVIIERAVLSRSTVNIVLGGKRRTVQRSLRIPDIELHDIGKASNGALAREALRQVFAALAREVRAKVRDTPGPWQGLIEEIRERREERIEGGGGLRERLRERRERRDSPDGGPGERPGVIERIRERREEREAPEEGSGGERPGLRQRLRDRLDARRERLEERSEGE